MAGSPPPTCIFNVEEFLERADKNANLFKDGGLLIGPHPRKFEKRGTQKICRSTKDNLLKALMSLRFWPQHIVQGVGVFMWNVLLLTPEDCISLFNRELIIQKTDPPNRIQGHAKDQSGSV